LSDEDPDLQRVRFYGVDDLAAGWHVPRAVELVEQFDPNNAPTNTVDVLELHNVQKYLEHGLLPSTLTDAERERVKERIPQIRSAVARHFSQVDNSNFAAKVHGIGHDYHADLLDLLGRSGAFNRCDASTVLPALTSTCVRLGDLLASKKLVTAYDGEIRGMLFASPRGAEHLVKKYLQADVRAEIHLPPSLTSVDSGELFERYVDSTDANPNYLGLIATSKEHPEAGIDDKLKLRAQRRRAEMNAKFFEQNTGFKTGCEVGIADDQAEPVLEDLRSTDDELVARYTYSRRWLDQTLDNASILNNFVHLFDFVDRHALLHFPSYPSQLGVMERFMGTPGKTEYRTGAAFRAIDWSSLLQIRLYIHYLETKDLNLEQVISWFSRNTSSRSSAPRTSPLPLPSQALPTCRESDTCSPRWTAWRNSSLST